MLWGDVGVQYSTSVIIYFHIFSLHILEIWKQRDKTKDNFEFGMTPNLY